MLLAATSAPASSPTQGAAATDLLAPRSTLHAPSTPSLPLLSIPLAVIPPAQPIATNYFAATATDTQGLASAYSIEVTNILYDTNSGLVTLAWDASPSTNVIASYTIYTGASPRTYTTTNNAGTNLTAAVWLIPPPLTNLVITVTATSGATNLVRSQSLSGPWTALGTTNYVTTNPPGIYYFRGIGKPGNAVVIRQSRF